MISAKSAIFIVIILTALKCDAFSFYDCYYDEATYHAEYVCGVKQGENFARRTLDYLYCNNYSTGIKRNNIQIVSFSGCKTNQIDGDFLEVFAGLRVFNISFVELENLHSVCFRKNKYLEQIIASHNHLSNIADDLFSYTTELTALDFSHNRITQLDPFVFDNASKLTTINFSFNLIEALQRRLFSNLRELEVLDLGNNRIAIIENDLLIHNKKLTRLNFNNNHVKRIECKFLATLVESQSLNIFLNTLESFDASCVNGAKYIDLNINISPNESTTALKISEGKFDWIFSNADFAKLRHLNLSNTRMENIITIIQSASKQLETLDLSNNFVGKLNESTFQSFTNLRNLYLKRANLSNFQFATFYHQRNLKVLDISYNNLIKIDFYLFLRNFQNLISLNLEGNDLTEIDSVTRSHFPMLSILAISKNNFSCDYLVRFLLKWPHLTLIDNPSNQTHMGGVDCFHTSQMEPTDQVDVGNTASNTHHMQYAIDQSNHIYSNNQSAELFTIKILLILILFVISVFFIVTKCKHPLQHIKERVMSSTTERSVAYNNQKNNVDMHMQDGLLIPQQLEHLDHLEI